MSKSKDRFPGFDAMNPMSWMGDFQKQAEKFRLPGVDIQAFIDWQRKDMEALTEANRTAFEGFKALAQRRNEIFQESIAQWQSALTSAGSTGGLSNQADVARQGFEKAIANFRELTEMEMQAHANAWKVLRDRMQQNMANLQELLTPKK